MLVSSEPASFMSEMLGYVVFILIPLLIAVWWTPDFKEVVKINGEIISLDELSHDKAYSVYTYVA